MDNDKINSLLDKVFELEGLLFLALQREDGTERLHDLIKGKVEKIYDMTAKLDETPSSGKEETGTESTVEVMDVKSSDLPDFFYSEAEEKIEAEKTESKEEDEKIDNDIADSSLFEEVEDAEPSVSLHKEKIIQEEMEEPAPKHERKPLRTLFSLNDKFRFSHELFKDSRQAFDSAISFIDSLDSIDEAEDYVYGDLGLDQEQDTVVEFMQVIEKHFE